jgi:hypothetical protein
MFDFFVFIGYSIGCVALGLFCRDWMKGPR